MDCRLLEGAMTAMSRCLLNHLSSEEVTSEPEAEGDAPEEVSAEAAAPVEEKPLVVQLKERRASPHLYRSPSLHPSHSPHLYSSLHNSPLCLP